MNIVVLFGGFSTERDVSAASAAMVARALHGRGHKVVPVDSFFGFREPYDKPEDVFLREFHDKIVLVGENEPNLEEIWASRNQNNNSLLGNNVIEICRAADITFLALHGNEGENGQLQAAFDIAGIKYTGSGYLGSALAMNKTLSKTLFAHAGIPAPAGITVYAGESSYPDTGFPCVVKPCSGGSSVGAFIVESREEYRLALERAFSYERSVIVEKFIKGRELTVGVIDGRAMPVVEIIPKEGFYDYRNKYQAGMTEEICPARLDPEVTKRVQQLGEKVNETLMIDSYCRVDFLMDENEVLYCLEANTLPGMTSTSLIPLMARAQGKSFGELCEEIIAVSMKKYG
jgi:D-alanine-D-alanine ligase